jgi:hypothetical protein
MSEIAGRLFSWVNDRLPIVILLKDIYQNIQCHQKLILVFIWSFGSCNLNHSNSYWYLVNNALLKY